MSRGREEKREKLIDILMEMRRKEGKGKPTDNQIFWLIPGGMLAQASGGDVGEEVQVLEGG